MASFLKKLRYFSNKQLLKNPCFQFLCIKRFFWYCFQRSSLFQFAIIIYEIIILYTWLCNYYYTHMHTHTQHQQKTSSNTEIKNIVQNQSKETAAPFSNPSNHQPMSALQISSYLAILTFQISIGTHYLVSCQFYDLINCPTHIYGSILDIILKIWFNAHLMVVLVMRLPETSGQQPVCDLRVELR